MLWRLTLAVAAVCVGGMCGCARAELMSRPMMPRDYVVKLCGREFIRAVIFTCGGSRWRRSTDADSAPFQWSSLSDVTMENNQQMWQHGIQLSDDSSQLYVPPSYSLADLLALYRAESDWRLQSPNAPMEDSQPLSDLRQQEGSPGASDWPAASKKKRNFSIGVAGICCSQGCTKNDIGRLC